MTAKPSTPAPAAAPATPAPAPAPCGCGCGAPTVRQDATYIAGHDARHAGNVGRAAIAADPGARADLIAALPTPALRAKAAAMVETAARKEAEKAARKAAAAAAKIAGDEARAAAFKAAMAV